MFTAVSRIDGGEDREAAVDSLEDTRASDDGDRVRAFADRLQRSLAADRASRQPGLGLEDGDHLLRQAQGAAVRADDRSLLDPELGPLVEEPAREALVVTGARLLGLHVDVRVGSRDRDEADQRRRRSRRGGREDTQARGENRGEDEGGGEAMSSHRLMVLTEKEGFEPSMEEFTPITP